MYYYVYHSLISLWLEIFAIPSQGKNLGNGWLSGMAFKALPNLMGEGRKPLGFVDIVSHLASNETARCTR
jgi:hypothetical protein